MRRLVFAALLLALHMCGPAHAGTPDTLNPLPTQGASFFGRLLTFLKGEDADRFNEMFAGFVVQGCLGAVDASLTHTPSSCIAYPAGSRSTETAAVTYGDAATCWTILDANTSGNLSSNVAFTRVSGTHYLTNCTTATQPSLPTGAVYLMKVVTSGGAITAVTDLRRLSPLASDKRMASQCGVIVNDDIDDTQAMQACVDAGGFVELQDGNIDITGNIALNSNLTIDGMGSNRSLFTKSGSGYLFTVDGTTTAIDRISLGHFGGTIEAGAGGVADWKDEFRNGRMIDLDFTAVDRASTVAAVNLTGQKSCNCFHQFTGTFFRNFRTCYVFSGFANANQVINGECVSPILGLKIKAVAPDTEGGDTNQFIGFEQVGGTKSFEIGANSDYNKFDTYVDEITTNVGTCDTPNSGNIAIDSRFSPDAPSCPDMWLFDSHQLNIFLPRTVNIRWMSAANTVLGRVGIDDDVSFTTRAISGARCWRVFDFTEATELIRVDCDDGNSVALRGALGLGRSTLAPATCNAEWEGAVYYDNETNRACYCNGDSFTWCPLDQAVGPCGSATDCGADPGGPLAGNGTINFADPGAGLCNTATFTVSGALAGSAVTLGIPSSALNDPESVFTASVLTDNVVTVRHCCIGATGCDPASGNFKAEVFLQ